SGTAMERIDRALSIPHRIGGRRIHSGIAGARLPGGSGQADLPVSAAHGAGVPASRAASLATASRSSRTVIRNVPDSASLVRDGNVRLRLSLVPDGRAGVGDLARLPTRHRADLPSQ